MNKFPWGASEAIDYIYYCRKSRPRTTSTMALEDMLSIANLELGLRWLNDRKTRRNTWDKSGKIKVWSIEDEV